MSATARLSQLAISPSGFVFDPRSGATFTVNPTGRTIIESLRDGKDLEATVELLGKSFDTNDADLRRDVFEYVGLLREQGLLPTDFELN
ncbi:MAG: PqqD family protein [bacterium]|nr:PqqD family protein [bacterium]